MTKQKAEHYYTEIPVSFSNKSSYNDTLLGEEFTFFTDHGVFSRNHTDTGTKELLEAVDLTREYGTILDLACGVGIIGITLGRILKNAKIVMTDINQRAVLLARENALLNKTKVAVYQGDAFAPLPKDEKFDLILTNPPIRAGKSQNFQMLFDASNYLNIGGYIYVVVRTKQGADSFKREMDSIYGNVIQAGQGSGFKVFCSEKINKND